MVPVGAAITKLLVPDKNNKLVDVVLGYDEAGEYMVRVVLLITQCRLSFSFSVIHLSAEPHTLHLLWCHCGALLQPDSQCQVQHIRGGTQAAGQRWPQLAAR